MTPGEALSRSPSPTRSTGDRSGLGNLGLVGGVVGGFPKMKSWLEYFCVFFMGFYGFSWVFQFFHGLFNGFYVFFYGVVSGNSCWGVFSGGFHRWTQTHRCQLEALFRLFCADRDAAVNLEAGDVGADGVVEKVRVERRLLEKRAIWK